MSKNQPVVVWEGTSTVDDTMVRIVHRRLRGEPTFIVEAAEEFDALGEPVWLQELAWTQPMREAIVLTLARGILDSCPCESRSCVRRWDAPHHTTPGDEGGEAAAA